MPLLVHRSNRTERLVDALVDFLDAPAPDPFAADAVVVHSRGLERFVQHALAQRLGICANVAFPFPHQLLADVQSAALDGLAPWTRDALIWAILDALQDPPIVEHPAMAPLRAWLDLEPEVVDRRRMELAQQLAALFDRYAPYRPELVAEWAHSDADPGWEPVLWRAVAARLDAPDPGEVAARLEAALRAGPELPGIPARIAFFSVGTLPPRTLRLVDALSDARPVCLLVLSPSPSSERTHPLLSSLGKLTTEFEQAIEARSPDLRDAFAPPAAETTLAMLQRDLLSPGPPRPLPDDASVRIHACHGRSRQVQVLRDELLWLLDTVLDLQPRDIVVMTPDIEAFAPLIQATFADGAIDWARREEHPGGLPRIPFRIADRGAARTNPVARLLLALLDLVDGRLPSSSLLDLAELPPVQARFGLTAEDLTTIREWTMHSGIRWGRDAAHRVAHGLPDDPGFTWRFGLDRALLGQAMAGDDPVLGCVPGPPIEGRDERALLGGAIDLFETVLDGLAELEAPRPPAAWRDALLALLDRLVYVDDDSAWALRQVEHALDTLADAAYPRPLGRRAVAVWLAEVLQAPDPGAGFLAGGVTFCQLVPMRAIPFRVVGLIGMDDGAFPRTGARLGFDRMASDPWPGDRFVRDDDRALFLEALLSARDHLVVTYSGRDPTDDRERPPAVPVAELLDVLDATFTTGDGAPARDHLIRQHPLHPFARRAFDGSHPAHDRRMARAARARIGDREPARPFLPAPLGPAGWPDELPLRLVDQLFAAPIRTLTRRSLGAWPPAEEVTVEDREPLDLGGGLELWALRDAVLRRGREGGELTEGGAIWRWALGSGALPLGMPGEAALRGVLEEVRGILEAAAPHLAEPTTTVEPAVRLQRTVLTGRAVLHGNRAVHLTASRVRGRRRFSAWLAHLLLCAGGHEVETHVCGLDTAIRLRPVAPDRATELLGRVVQLYDWGLRLPLMWFPEASWAWFRAQRYARDPDDGLVRGLRSVLRGWGRYGEPDDATRRVIGDRCPFDPAVDLSDVLVPRDCKAWELAAELWGPVGQHTEEGA